jgi:hypothetical protein
MVECHHRGRSYDFGIHSLPVRNGVNGFSFSFFQLQIRVFAVSISLNVWSENEGISNPSLQGVS